MVICPANSGDFKLSLSGEKILINNSADSFLRKIVVHKANVKTDNINCGLGTLSPFLYAANKNLGIAQKVKWKTCKQGDVVRSVVAVVDVGLVGNESFALQYHWSVPESAKNLFDEFSKLIVDEQIKELLNIYRCDEKLYLQTCNFKN